jgi:alpha-ribazole phosphatase
MNTELFLIRHGQPVLQNALLGSTDSPLSETGWQQLERCFDKLCAENIDLIVTSPLSRCANFAQYFSAEKMIKLEINADWRECHFGDWDGKTYQQLHHEFPQAMADFYHNPSQHTPPNGEKLAAFNQRVIQAVLNLVKKNQGKRIAILAHAGVIRTLAAWCLKMDLDSGNQFKKMALDYASVTQLNIFQNVETGDDKNTSTEMFSQLIKLNYV